MGKKIIKINIAKDFSEYPGTRKKAIGKNSGEEFRENILEPKFKEIMNNENHYLEIDLRGIKGSLGTSFLDESFGGLARKYSSALVLKKLIFIVPVDDPLLKDEIKFYIQNANNG